MSPKVSIIIPVYNAAAHINETIDSILNQSYTNFEVIIVNDGSVDNSEAVIRSVKDERIRYFAQPNRGQCAASNYGLRQSRGELVKFLDADDIMNPHHLQAQVDALGTNASDRLVSCLWGRFYSNDLSTFSLESNQLEWNVSSPMDWLRKNLSQKSDMMPVWFWLIPRDLINRAGGWDERLSLNNDFEYSIRLLMHASDIKLAANAVIYYRSGSATSLSQIRSEKSLRAAYLSIKLGCTYLLEKDDSRLMKSLCAAKYQTLLFQAYPAYPSLVKDIEADIEELGGSDGKLEGGVFIKTLQKMVGWKLAMRIKLLIYDSGYDKVIARKKNTKVLQSNLASIE